MAARPTRSTISLTPLSDEDTARLVGELLDQALLPAEVQQALLDRAEGNPLYAQEYVRMLQDRGLLVEGDGGWTLTGEVEGLPESIQGIIAARLDTLTADEKAIQDAAVIGKTAWIGAVCALTERTSWEAEELLHGWSENSCCSGSRRSLDPRRDRVHFAHALTRDVAYSQIRRADRAQKHEAAAAVDRTALRRARRQGRTARRPLHQRPRPCATQLGEDTTSLAPKARAAFTEAAHQAAAVYAHPAAARHYHAALALTPPDDTHKRAALLLGEATALFNAETADEQTLQAAVDAQVAAEEWEAAAQGRADAHAWDQEMGPEVRSQTPTSPEARSTRRACHPARRCARSPQTKPSTSLSRDAPRRHSHLPTR